MGSLERSKKKVQLWQKAIVHFLLCFVMGFFTGFAPTNTNPSIFSTHSISEIPPQPVEISPQTQNFNTSLPDKTQVPAESTQSNDSELVQNSEEEEEESIELIIPRRLVIIITPTSLRDELRGVNLWRLGSTLKLVPPPLLWVVVEGKSDSSEISEVLRKTGVMYRHLVVKENFTNGKAEMDRHRNVALNHIEHHRLSGIVHFAGLSNFYGLDFFEEIRRIEVFGTWPMAFLSANKRRVKIEGPVCDSSEVVGWHLKKMNNLTDTSSPVHISSFAFNSSILWDPERWGRLSSAQHTSQNSIKFVEKEVLKEETKLKGIPSEGCSKIMLWSLRIPTGKKATN